MRIRLWLEHNGVEALALLAFPIAAVLLILALGGCSLRPAVRLPARVEVAVASDPALEAQCQALDRKVMGFTGTAVGLGAAGGATGLASIFTTSTNRYATASASASVAILSAVFTYLSNAESQLYTRTCTAGTTGAAP